MSWWFSYCDVIFERDHGSVVVENFSMGSSVTYVVTFLAPLVTHLCSFVTKHLLLYPPEGETSFMDDPPIISLNDISLVKCRNGMMQDS